MSDTDYVCAHCAERASCPADIQHHPSCRPYGRWYVTVPHKSVEPKGEK